MGMKITVVGAGSWGTALAILLGRNDHEVHLLGRNRDDLLAMAERRENLRYLPGFVLPPSVRTFSIEEWKSKRLSDQERDLTVLAVPSHALRSILGEVPGSHPCVVVAAKGLEARTGQSMVDIVREGWPQAAVGVLSGPNLALEIVRGIPTAAVSAYPSLEDAERVRQAFMCRTFRVYLSQDVVGVELAGALKNVLAIGAGMSDGLGYGGNTKGALLARGLHEMTVLGLKLGAKVETFMGLAGVGDLFATASSNLSRNYRVGFAVGGGETLSSALGAVGQVAEGVSTSESAQLLARRNQVSMPVFEAIEAVLRGQLAPLRAVELLMERMPRQEGFLGGD
jgi:glycerol-3-phosphate dehydrogenase (NAD(P)+)